MTKVQSADWKGASKDSVRTMFNSIAGRYDFLNHLLSGGIDKIWRAKLVCLIKESFKQDKLSNFTTKDFNLLDVATGTGDLLLTLVKNRVAHRFFGVDISANMLDFAHKKIDKIPDKNVEVALSLGDAENLNFPDEYFTFVTVAFGVRNFENLNKGLSEMYRTLRIGGKVFVLEFSIPKNFFVRWMYFLYFRYILPFIGGLISRNRFAYTYLPESVSKFPNGKRFCDVLSKVGFSNPKIYQQTFGIASIYEATKLSPHI